MGLMELMTRIDIPLSEWKIPVGARVLLVGSCFADEIGEKMVRGGFDAKVNPFGTLYNPASIAASLLRSISEREVSQSPKGDHCSIKSNKNLIRQSQVQKMHAPRPGLSQLATTFIS